MCKRNNTLIQSFSFAVAALAIGCGAPADAETYEFRTASAGPGSSGTAGAEESDTGVDTERIDVPECIAVEVPDSEATGGADPDPSAGPGGGGGDDLVTADGGGPVYGEEYCGWIDLEKPLYLDSLDDCEALLEDQLPDCCIAICDLYGLVPAQFDETCDATSRGDEQAQEGLTGCGCNCVKEPLEGA